MLKYAKVINEETKACEVGLGTNSAFYQSIGMAEMEVEQAYDGSWYVKGYAPVQPISEQNEAIRATREQLYSTQIDPLHARKARKVILNDWSEADEAEYVAEVARISKEIEDENLYMGEHPNDESL